MLRFVRFMEASKLSLPSLRVTLNVLSFVRLGEPIVLILCSDPAHSTLLPAKVQGWAKPWLEWA